MYSHASRSAARLGSRYQTDIEHVTKPRPRAPMTR
jgi:hypothetical protein